MGQEDSRTDIRSSAVKIMWVEILRDEGGESETCGTNSREAENLAKE